ncbi:TetR/AcrR family transcriptional regulator [Schumannella sp. 10F1B-5-1]|uniref:TetR/AcrR family transcriptional regulator n=1 Tax=Schumannella sp. 10F1B-5-1 TaxID=2590780 RepID=UPI0011321D53|nr:TetR/AcrR family transcriptional regulator [Schumannella sp. 10F1B-5-1]TPW78360.1 TetR/AcrR family transcriptional regulator [Schumannella sp. 10F1B-5-1]
MNADTTAAAPSPTRGTATRERLLDAAAERFYAQGIRATSADRIIDDVGVTKVTFYRHFRTKSDLVVAYLERQSAAERAWMLSTRQQSDPRGSLRELATGIGEASCQAGFRGCAFINAAAEFPDADDPVRAVVAAHRSWMRDQFAEIAAEAGASDARAVADQLMLLRDGAMVNGYLAHPESVASTLGRAFEAVIDERY